MVFCCCFHSFRSGTGMLHLLVFVSSWSCFGGRKASPLRHCCFLVTGQRRSLRREMQLHRDGSLTLHLSQLVAWRSSGKQQFPFNSKAGSLFLSQMKLLGEMRKIKTPAEIKRGVIKKADFFFLFLLLFDFISALMKSGFKLSSGFSSLISHLTRRG